jgi:hypothetical protein
MSPGPPSYLIMSESQNGLDPESTVKLMFCPGYEHGILVQVRNRIPVSCLVNDFLPKNLLPQGFTLKLKKIWQPRCLSGFMIASKIFIRLNATYLYSSGEF